MGGAAVMLRHRVVAVATVAATILPMLIAAPAIGAAPSIDVFLRDIHGHSVSGARVQLALMTNGNVGIGSIAAFKQEAVSDASGRASWAPAFSRAERAAIDRNGGWANFSAMVLDSSGRPRAFVSLSNYFGTNSAATRRKSPGSTVLADVMPDPSVDSPSYTGCVNYHYELTSTSTSWTDVGESHVAGDATNKFTYGRTADSTIDASYKQSGFGWGVSGSVNIGNSLSSSVSQTIGPYIYRHELSQFNYGRWQEFADCYEGSHLYMGWDHVEAISWVGGIQYSSYSDGYYDNNRTSHWNFFGPTSTFDRSSSDFTKESVAVTTPWGATLGAQSGSSTFVKDHYAFGSHASHYLYGRFDYPTNATVIYASDN